MINPWFKFYGSEYLSDIKIKKLNSDERSCWVTLLCMASTSSVPGIVEFLDNDILIKESGVENKTNFDVLSKFEYLRMITRNDNGSIEILNWNKRQENTALSGYERIKRHRARNTNDNAVITNDNNDNENDNARIEENRIEKNRKDNTRTDIASAPQTIIWQTQDWAEEKANQLVESTNNVIDKKYFLLEIQKFRNYWTEKNPGGKKERWQMQKVFDPSRRLGTWMRNFLERASQKKSTSESKYKVAEV